MTSEKKQVERGYTGECHPDVFSVVPEQPTDVKPGQLTKEQINQFFNQGYVMIPDFFTDDELDPIKKRIVKYVDEIVEKLFKAGKIKDKHEDADLFHRLTLIEKDFPGANVIAHKIGAMPQEVCDVLANKRMLNVIEQLVGPNIGGSAVWNLRTKTPKSSATVVPWHQDCGYFDNDSYKVLIPTAWIPLLDTNETNGGMQMMKNAHKKGLVANHTCCAGPTWYIDLAEDEMEQTLDVCVKKDSEVVPVPYKGMLLFHNLTPHRSLPNISDDIRWSLDLRWHSLDEPDCFWGLKPPAVLRTKEEPDLVPDWTVFNSTNRHTIQDNMLGKEHDDFDTTISGPWMLKWDIVNHNVHTNAMDKDETWVAAEEEPVVKKSKIAESEN